MNEPTRSLCSVLKVKMGVDVSHRNIRINRNYLRNFEFPDKLLNCMGKEVFYEGA